MQVIHCNSLSFFFLYITGRIFAGAHALLDYIGTNSQNIYENMWRNKNACTSWQKHSSINMYLICILRITNINWNIKLHFCIICNNKCKIKQYLHFFLYLVLNYVHKYIYINQHMKNRKQELLHLPFILQYISPFF